MTKFLKTNEIWVFLILAPLFNAAFAYARFIELVPSRIYTHGSFFILFFLLLFMVGLLHGFEGIKNLFKPMLQWRVALKWIGLAACIGFALSWTALLLKALYLGGDFSVFKLNTSVVSNPRTILNIALWAFIGEVIWVGYAIRQLSKRMVPFFASLIVGVFWTLWWVPIVIIGIGAIPDLPILPLMVHMMGIAGMCAVVYGHTKSGLCVWLMQFMLNISGLMVAVSPATGGIPTYMVFAGLYFLTMLVFMYLMAPTQKMILGQEG